MPEQAEEIPKKIRALFLAASVKRELGSYLILVTSDLRKFIETKNMIFTSVKANVFTGVNTAKAMTYGHKS
jgi:hypothetical protein